MLIVFLLALPALAQQSEPLVPDWCRSLPRPVYKTLTRVPAPGDWFEVYRIRPGIFAIYEPHQFEEVISYLIIGNRRALLFDTGLGVASMRDLVTHLTALPVIVVNSHTHFDHVGGNADFSSIYGRHTSYTRANTRGGSTDYSRDTLTPARLCGPLPAGVRADHFVTRPWTISHFVHDGEILSLGGRDLEVLFTPGHTPDSLSLLDRRHGLLFTGDTYYPGPIYLFVPETSFPDYARSIARLARLAPSLKLVLPAHNEPVASPDVLVKVDRAVKEVQAGTATAVISDGRREFKFDGFSLLLPAK